MAVSGVPAVDFMGQLGISSLSKPTSFVQALEEGVKSISSRATTAAFSSSRTIRFGGWDSIAMGNWGMVLPLRGIYLSRSGARLWPRPPSLIIAFSRDQRDFAGMGRNKYGQLGDGTNTDRSSPIIIFPSGVADFAVGGHHSLVLKTDGTLWAFGRNGTGQLGDGSTTNRSTPVQIPITNVVKLAGGHSFSLILKNDGSLWAMGNNSNGQLGDGSTTIKTSPIMIVDANVSDIACGAKTGYFIKTDGSLWGMGRSSNGELGNLAISNDNLQGWWWTDKALIFMINQVRETGIHNRGVVSYPDRYGRDRAMQFDGVDDKIEITENTNLAIDDNMSFFLWFNNQDSNSPPSAALLEEERRGSDRGMEAQEESTTHLSVVLWSASNDINGHGHWEPTGFNDIGFDTWNHVGFTYEGGTITAYWNGSQVDQDVVSRFHRLWQRGHSYW